MSEMDKGTIGHTCAEIDIRLEGGEMLDVDAEEEIHRGGGESAEKSRDGLKSLVCGAGVVLGALVVVQRS